MSGPARRWADDRSAGRAPRPSTTQTSFASPLLWVTMGTAGSSTRPSPPGRTVTAAPSTTACTRRTIVPGTTAPSRSIGVVAKSTFSCATNRDGVAWRRANSCARSASPRSSTKSVRGSPSGRDSWTTIASKRSTTSARSSGSPHHRVSSAGSRRGWPRRAWQARPRKGCSASSPAAPEPRALASPTVPSREAWSRPGTPLPVAVAQLERIGLGVVDATQQDVDRLQAAERAQPDPTVADRQVAALGQVVAELLGQVRVLEVAGVAEAGREDDGAAVRPVLRGQRGRARPAAPRRTRSDGAPRGRGARQGTAGRGRCG